MNYVKKLHYINGKWSGGDLDMMEVHNPATQELVGEVPRGGTEETRTAIDAAHDAFQTWSQTTAYERAALLDKFNDAILENTEELAQIMTMEMGKPFAEAKGEVAYAASFIDWFAAEGKRVYGQTIPAHLPGKRMQVWKQPVGVVAAITPWNFPLAMLTRKMGPALAAGCTVVIKPSRETPLSAIRLVELCEEVGFPPGVVNIVTGSSSQIGGEMMSNEKVRKITFTGSTEIGKQLMRQGADTVKRLSLELGGHAPIIVLDDADIDKAVQGTLASKFRNSGQTCICGNRIYVHARIYDEFVTRFTAAVEDLKLGNGMDQGVNVGPLINLDGVEKVQNHVQDAVEKGAEVTTGGSKAEDIGPNYYKPTVIKDVNHDMIVMSEETFGPVAPIQKITSDEEAVKLANDTPFGLAAYVFTESNSRGIQLIEKLNYGIVGWNDGAPSAAQAPFGGMKESGMGREGGQQGIEDFLEKQYVSIGL
ncbi:NAD-dependent succinate-semialdehyde dehydrogenase [Alteribacillus iranensis]|uniref:Succinate semialdehyde dehydrogenase n=1 Tax=Alteribacillus iranensis TaxID=930128 RepID=A0A1I2BKP9_9BACI|nr:NAD-dependent succinate-semialdehyde dehydrogenase [Alteribacillus iranensis]SFE56794.1 succinate semialdehyde dehydrogenase [Alteribacillus iranensis]